MTTTDYFNATPAAREQMIADARRTRTHRGPANPAAELETVMKRAKASYAARIHKLPAPKWGKRSA